MARPKFKWSEYDAAIRVAPGLVEAAGHMRQHAAAGDVFAVAGLTTAHAAFDLAVQVCALSGLPAYLSRPHLEAIKDRPRREVVATRFAALDEIAALSDYAKAMQALQKLRVQWYLVAGDASVQWDAQRGRATFRAGSVSLYRIP